MKVLHIEDNEQNRYRAPFLIEQRGFTVPIVAVTSFMLAGDREESLAADRDDSLEKPIHPATFVDDIGRFPRPLEKERAP